MILNRSKAENIVTVFFILMINLSAYPIMGSSIVLGEILLLGSSAFLLIFNRKFCDVKGLGWFWLYILIQSLVLALLSVPYAEFRLTIIKFILLSMRFFIVLVIASRINPKLLYKIYWIICLIAIGFVFIQAIQIWILNVPMTIMIPFADLSSKAETLSYIENRPCAFFLEPQHLCSFFMPLVVIELNKENYVKAGILTFTILLTTSTQGLICAAAVWIMFLLTDDARKLRSKLIILLLILVFVILFLYSNLFVGSLEKLQNTSLDTNIRTVRSFEVFKAMPFFDKITGIGMSNVNNYLKYSHVCSEWILSEKAPARNFISSFFGNFVEFGVVGGICYLLMTASMFKSANKTGRIFVILILLSALSQTITYNSWMIFYWVIFYTISDDKKLIQMRW